MDRSGSNHENHPGVTEPILAASRSTPPIEQRPTVAEFFAGIGLMRLGLEKAGFRIVWANDIAEQKRAMYAAQFDGHPFVLADIRSLHGAELPTVNLATASFPCTDVSLAGDRAGLSGAESGMFWQFARLIDELGSRRPFSVLLENVAGLASSNGGADMVAVLGELNRLGYSCDVLAVDAKHFVAQSRPRLFVVGLADHLPAPREFEPSPFRPDWAEKLRQNHPELHWMRLPLPTLEKVQHRLAESIEELADDDLRWWDSTRREKFLSTLPPIHAVRLNCLAAATQPEYRTAYRRTRGGVPVWEIRADQLAGCLRTARGGSSKQAIVRAGCGRIAVRWMTAREYANLQGAAEYAVADFPVNQAIFGFGDAVCVPAVAFIGRALLAQLSPKFSR